MVTALDLSFDDWNRHDGRVLGALTPGTLGSFVADVWYDHMARMADVSPGAAMRQHRGQRYLDCSGQAAIRIKMIDRSLRSRNLRTPHAIAWMSQLAMRGMPPSARLTFGYRVDTTRTLVRDAFLALPRNDSTYQWIWQVKGKEADIFEPRTPQLLTSPEHTQDAMQFFYDPVAERR